MLLSKKTNLNIVRILLVSFASLSGVSCASYNHRPEVQAFTQRMVSQHGFSQTELENLFAQVHPQHTVVNTITAPKEKKPWYAYQTIMLTPVRIQEGANFWKNNTTALSAAEKEYGVPASLIVAIIGVETRYGTFLGSHRVFDALTTLAFDYSPRKTFFRHELEEYLLLTRELNWAPREIYGSYAGAIGQPQFMPSSYRRFAITKNVQGHSDLLHNADDAIYSTANYLKNKGWHPNEPITTAVTIKGSKLPTLLDKEKGKTQSLQLSVKGWKHRGVQVKPIYSDSLTAQLIELENKDKSDFWLGFNNFSVIMKYNASVNYSMAVYQLSKKIEEAVKLKTSIS